MFERSSTGQLVAYRSKRKRLFYYVFIIVYTIANIVIGSCRNHTPRELQDLTMFIVLGMMEGVSLPDGWTDVGAGSLRPFVKQTTFLIPPHTSFHRQAITIKRAAMILCFGCYRCIVNWNLEFRGLAGVNGPYYSLQRYRLHSRSINTSIMFYSKLILRTLYQYDENLLKSTIMLKIN